MVIVAAACLVLIVLWRAASTIGERAGLGAQRPQPYMSDRTGPCAVACRVMVGGGVIIIMRTVRGCMLIKVAEKTEM